MTSRGAGGVANTAGGGTITADRQPGQVIDIPLNSSPTCDTFPHFGQANGIMGDPV